MNSSDTKRRIRTLLDDLLSGIDPSELTDSADLFDIGLDSVNAMALVTGLQEVFDLELSDAEIDVDNFATIDAIAALVVRKAALIG